MKKSIALLLCGAMALSMVAGCGNAKTADTSVSEGVKEETAEQSSTTEAAETEAPAEEVASEKTYDEHIDFTCTGYYSLYQAANGHDIEADPVIQWVEDKFNVTIDQWACEAANAGEEVRLWVNGGTMPDYMVWPSLSVSEMTEYADQGLIQPLPDGWEEKWPNLAKMVKNSGYGEMVKVDGVTYAIPHSVFGNFNSMETPVAHGSLYFRKDWAEQVGMADLGADYTIKFSELKEYLEKVKEAGLCDNPTLGGNVSQITEAFRLSNGINSEDFIATDDGYIWEAEQDGYAEYIQNIQEWYNAGLIDPDFYVKDKGTIQIEFQEGYLAAMYYDGNVGSYGKLMDNLMTTAGEDKLDEELRATYRDRFGMATIEGEDDMVYAIGIYSYWLLNSFSPECDEATMERILDIVDWYCTPEGQASVRCGIPGEDFSIDENNVITILNEDIISGEYSVSPSAYFNVWGYCGDDIGFAEGIPGSHLAEQKNVLANYAVKQAGTVFPKDNKVHALATEAKKNYSVDINAAIAEIVSGNKDAAVEWPAFIENNRGIWEPVVNDLDALE